MKVDLDFLERVAKAAESRQGDLLFALAGIESDNEAMNYLARRVPELIDEVRAVTDFRRPPPRYVLTRTGTAPDVVYCATLADVDAAMRSWYPDTLYVITIGDRGAFAEVWDLGEMLPLATMTEVFE